MVIIIHEHFILSLGGSGVLIDGEDPRTITNEEWKKRLTADQFYITRQKGTEAVRQNLKIILFSKEILFLLLFRTLEII